MSTFISAFLDTWGIWATIFGLPLLALWMERTARRYKNARRAKVSEARDLANARTKAHVATPLCTARWDNLHCQRAAWHAGQHAHTMPSGKVVAWPNLADCGGAA